MARAERGLKRRQRKARVGREPFSGMFQSRKLAQGTWKDGGAKGGIPSSEQQAYEVGWVMTSKARASPPGTQA